MDGFVFKNLEGTGELFPFEDWRLTDMTHAEDLDWRMSIDEMKHSSVEGLEVAKPQFYSRHVNIFLNLMSYSDV